MYQLSKELELNNLYDCIVVGGGPSGCAAAVAAARDGAKTLLIERSSCLGGMGTSGLVPFWCGFSNGGAICANGIAKKVLKASNQAVLCENKSTPEKMIFAIDPEALKGIYDDLVTEAGVHVLFNAWLASVDADGEGNVRAIIVADKRGLTAYSAKIYIDCTGDADLAAWAGAEFVKGDVDGELQAATLCFTLTNVDTYQYLSTRTGNPYIDNKIGVNIQIGPGAVGFNAGHIYGVDSTDPENVSKALFDGRKLARQITEKISKEHPRIFGNAFLVNTGAQMGARESRRIKGDYVLSAADYFARAVFDDEIARNCYDLDTHFSKKEKQLYSEGKISLPDEKDIKVYAPGESHGIPYRCLVPEKLKNVLVAGRSISTDRKVNGSIRVMAPCLSTGEAAGVAAALAVNTHNYNVHTLDVSKIRARILEEDGYIL